MPSTVAVGAKEGGAEAGGGRGGVSVAGHAGRRAKSNSKWHFCTSLRVFRIDLGGALGQARS
eukprot:1943350-Rhodomonas_salina.2